MSKQPPARPPATRFAAGAWPVLTVAVAGLSYMVADPGSLVPLPAIAFCMLGRWVQRPPKPWHAPDWAIAVAVLAVIAYAVVVSVERGFEVRTFAHFMVLLAAIKCFERRTARDDGQLLLISIFVILSTAVSSSELVPGLLTLLYVLFVIIAAMRVQIDIVVPADDARPVGVARLGWTAYLLVGSLGFGLFFVLPRDILRSEGGASLAQAQQGVAAFRESVELGTGGLISSDETLVMTAEIVRRLPPSRAPRGRGGGPQEDALGHAVLRFRGRTLDQYRDGRWEPSRAVSEAINETIAVVGASSQRLGLFDAGTDDRVLVARVEQFAGASQGGTLFAIQKPSTFGAVSGDVRLAVNRIDRTIRSRDQIVTGLEYEVTSMVRSGDPPSFGVRDAVAPPPDPGYRAFAESILLPVGLEPDPLLRPQADDHAVVTLLSNWLRINKQYTLDIEPSPPGADPTLWFIRSGRAGHCEYFASSLALLCRSVGIPARVVTGYLLTEYDPPSGRYQIRRSHAHAWVEAQIGLDDWREFDATPEGVFAGSNGRSVNPLTRWLSSIETAWLSSFVSFDRGDQDQIRSRFARVFGGADTERERESRGASNRPRNVIAWILIGSSVLIGIWAAAGLFRRPARRGHPGIPPEAAAAVRELERFWKRRGTPRPRGSTLGSHARSVGPEQALAIVPMIERVAFAEGSPAELRTNKWVQRSALGEVT
ncbi:MAG: DUF3488 and transglutaminase-like domain-containing protein [Planctomycetota bacterium]